MKRLFIIKTTFVNIWCTPSSEHFPIVSEIALPFEHNSAREILFLTAYFCWDSRLSSREMHQKSKCGGTTGFD